MIDQENFGGIDEYIKRHSLQDSSLAEARRAKLYNVNAPKNTEEAAAAETTGVEEESELQKAQRELEDQEDEEDEEDYDPGSDGESEGSGSSSDEDSDEDEFHENAENVSDGDEDELKEELGSEPEEGDEE